MPRSIWAGFAIVISVVFVSTALAQEGANVRGEARSILERYRRAVALPPNFTMKFEYSTSLQGDMPYHITAYHVAGVHRRSDGVLETIKEKRPILIDEPPVRTFKSHHIWEKGENMHYGIDSGDPSPPKIIASGIDKNNSSLGQLAAGEALLFAGEYIPAAAAPDGGILDLEGLIASATAIVTRRRLLDGVEADVVELSTPYGTHTYWLSRETHLPLRIEIDKKLGDRMNGLVLSDQGPGGDGFSERNLVTYHFVASDIVFDLANDTIPRSAAFTWTRRYADGLSLTATTKYTASDVQVGVEFGEDAFRIPLPDGTPVYFSPGYRRFDGTMAQSADPRARSRVPYEYRGGRIVVRNW